MNQLDKLIQQYERENPGEKAETVYYNTAGDGFNKWNDNFVIWLASRPNCGKEQRKFLDEVEKMCIRQGIVINSNDDTVMYDTDWDSDLQKVIKGE